MSRLPLRIRKTSANTCSRRSAPCRSSLQATRRRRNGWSMDGAVGQTGRPWKGTRTAAHATALELPDSPAYELPTDELRQAVFAAVPDAVTGPLASPGGWQVLRVTHVTPPRNQTLDDVRDQVRADLVRPLATWPNERPAPQAGRRARVGDVTRGVARWSGRDTGRGHARRSW